MILRMLRRFFFLTGLLSMLSFLNSSPLKLPHLEVFENQISAKGSILFKTESGHHFNQSSPLNCGSGGRMVDKDNKTLKCEYPKEGSYKAFLAICDDTLKYCKIFQPEILVGRNIIKKKTTPPKKQKVSENFGFKIGNPEKLLEDFRKQIPPRSTLIDFFALWCPPCNDLDELVFSNKKFQKYSKNLNKMKVNVDEEESWRIKERFQVTSYPTLIYLNKNGEEVGRFWGTQSPEILKNWLQKMKQLESKPLSWALQQSDEESVQRVAEWHYDRGHFSEVKSLTGARKEDWAQKLFLRSESSMATENKKKSLQKEILLKLLDNYPKDVNYGYWLLDLAHIETIKKKSIEKELSLAIENINFFIKNPTLAEKENVSTQDLVILKADLFEAFEKKEELQKAEQEAIEFFEKTLKKGKKISRGRSHILAYYYRETGRLEEAKKIYESLVKDNPQEFTFYYRYATALKKLKEFDLALEWIDKGYPYLTKGNSQIQFATLKGQILRDLKRPEEALEVVLGSLSMLTRADWEKDRRNTLLDELTALKEELREIVRLSKQSK
jgi:thioredoxin-like negative regulator of GroEL